MDIEEVKLIGMKGFALYGEPIWFLKYSNENWRQVFYNPSSDYGYWRTEDALNYTSYINSDGNMDNWDPNRHKFLLFYDMDAPKYWDNWKYLMFIEDDKDAEDSLNEYLELFNDEKTGRVEVTKYLINVTSQYDIYNQQRTLESKKWMLESELNDAIDREKKYREWKQDEEMATKEWKFKSNSHPGKFYRVKYKKYNDGWKLTCNCPAWIYNHSGDRTCKHTKMVESMLKGEKYGWWED
jgi:hypothetical protein